MNPLYSSCLSTSHPAQLGVGSTLTPVSVFIDFSSDTSFIDKDFIQKLKIQSLPLSQSFQVHSLNNQLLHHVELQTQDISLTIDNHSEQISFLIIHFPHHPVVLGIPWLEKHNPQLDWKMGRLLQWSTPCLAFFL